MEVDGQSYPTKPYQAGFSKHNSLECYEWLLDTLKQHNNPIEQFLVTRNSFRNGYIIFGFDLTPGGTGRGPLTLVKQGNLSEAVTFGEPLQKTAMMVRMMIHDSILEIIQHRQVIVDFATWKLEKLTRSYLIIQSQQMVSIEFFSADKVPPDYRIISAVCVINTESSDEPGKHWIAVY